MPPRDGEPPATGTVRAEPGPVPGPAPDTDTRSGQRNSWLIAWMLFAFITLNFADKAVVGLAARPIRAELGLGPSQFGLLGSAFFWLFAVGSVGLMVVLRKLSFGWAATFLMITWIATMVPLTVPTSFAVLLVSRVLLGFFEGPAQALCQTIVAERFRPESRALAGSLVVAGAAVGPLLSAPVLTYVIVRFDWHAAFMLLIGLGAAWLVCWRIVTRGQPLLRRNGPAAAEPAGTEATGTAQIDVGLGRLLRLGTFWGLAVLCLAGYSVTALKIAWLPAFLGEGLGYPPATVGLLVTLPYGSAVLVLLATGWLSGRLVARGYTSRVARGGLSAVCLAVSGLAMIAFTVLPAGPVQFALVVLAFSTSGVSFAVGFQAVSDFLPHRHRAAFFGALVAVYSLAGIATPYVFGLVLEAAPSIAEGYATAFAVLGASLVVMAAVGAALTDPEKSRQILLRATEARNHTATGGTA